MTQRKTENKEENFEKGKGKNKKVLSGIVVSTKSDKTAVVRVERYASHPKYKKFVRIHKKYKAHDPKNSCSEGEQVLIRESRKYSKDKYFKVVEKIK